jgi:hypothetical protein
MTTTATALGPVVDVLVARPVEDLCVTELQAVLTGVVPQVQRLEGFVSVVCGELQARTGGVLRTEDGGSRSVASWLAEQQRDTPSAAGSVLRTSGLLRSLPLVAAAVLDGVITQRKAAVLTRLVGKIPDEQLREVQPQLVQVATLMNPEELAAWVRHELATHCEPVLDDDAESARRRRFLQTSRDADGSLRGRFLLPPEDAEVFLTVNEPLARRDGLADDRTAGQRRADALTGVHEQVLRHGELPDHGGHRPQINYVLPADWAAKQAERDACPVCFSCPEHRPASFADTVAASLPGHGGIPAEHACATAAWTGPATRAVVEALLCQARISRVLLDSLGQVTGLESLTDTVTRAQRRALAARDVTCATRGCTRPPSMCDAHHLDHLQDGGDTTLDNLVLLCRRHHVLWHLGTISLRDLHVPWHPDATSTGPPQE